MGMVIGKIGSTDIENSSIGPIQLSTDVAGPGLIGGAGSPLQVDVDNASIEISTENTVKVKDDGIKDNHIDFGLNAEQVGADDLPYDPSTWSVLVSTRTQQALDEITDIVTPESVTPPPNPFEGKRWLDTSSNPNVLKIYKNGVWVEEQYFDTTTNQVIYDGGEF
jgi:hypothetical protein